MANRYKIEALEGDNLTEPEYLALLYAANSGRHKGGGRSKTINNTGGGLCRCLF